MFLAPRESKQTTEKARKGICKDSTHNDLLATAWHIYEKSKLVWAFCFVLFLWDKKKKKNEMETVNQIHFYIFQ